jgi:flavin reductase (NADH)
MMGSARQQLTASVRQQDYRDLMSAFPTGVTVVTSLGAGGEPRGMTCSSLASASLFPPTVLVCLRTGSGTLQASLEHGEFAVNFLHEDGWRAAEVFSGPDPHRFTQVEWERSASGIPWLVRDAFAVAECRVSGTCQVGDHVVVFGEVVKIARSDGNPLLYGLRGFAAWPGRMTAG